MKQSEYDELVKSALPDVAENYYGGVMVIPLTDNLRKVIDCGFETLKQTIESD